MNTWIQDAVTYHLFPLGSTGAPKRNDFTCEPSERLNTLHDWLPYLSELGATTLLLGPVLESGSHGYDTRRPFYGRPAARYQRRPQSVYRCVSRGDRG